ncbi:MAG: diguanylate cyclase [Halofilum sp. (in: g-proteobacteria)]|nr:diguanylate cyclase [Halofilum sp. (in: g-proteobacteria)]
MRANPGGWPIRIAIAVVLTIAAGTWIYYHERDAVLAAAANTYSVRADLIREYVALMRHKVYALEEDIESRHTRIAQNGDPGPWINAIRPFPGYNVWGIPARHAEKLSPPLRGSLSGSAVLADPSGTLRTELATILEVDSQFQTLLRHVTEIASVHYTSSNGFIYLAPALPVAEFRYSPSVYDKPSWTRATPRNNTNRRQIITELHENPNGKGRIISIASPVAFVGRFTGVVSIDITINRLREFTNLGQATGESILVDEEHRIVARNGEFDLDETYAPVTGGGWRVLDDGAYWMGETIVARELRLLHRLPEWSLAVAAARQSRLAWGILAAAVVMVLISIRLNDALGQLQGLMNRDPLTFLLNRHGFEIESEKLRESLDHDREMRSSLQLGSYRTALVMFDVDHFKEINDTHGHELGDDVLFSLARRMSASVNEQDLVCRWGGEEILVLLVAERVEYFRPIAERLRETVAQRPLTSDNIPVTISGGLVEWRRDESLEHALRRADELLYKAKDAGRNRVETDIPV